MIIHYTDGLLFSEDRHHLALVLKQKPQWMAGYWNAIGGKVESNETYEDCVRREFYEEAGVEYPYWEQFLRLTGDGFVVEFFRGFSDRVFDCYSADKERIAIFPVERVPSLNVFPNIRWILPMALHAKSGDQLAMSEYAR